MTSTFMEVPGCHPSQPHAPARPANLCLQGKRAAMVTFSQYPFDPRPRRAIAALRNEGMSVDLICLWDEKSPRHEQCDGLEIVRVPIKHHRGGKLSYFYQYFAFMLVCACILAKRAFKRRYDLVYVNNMPDVLVLSALVPKALGAKVILDMHDPMPELMTTIYNLDSGSLSVRMIRWLEKWSMKRADLVLTVNIACKRIFAARSCRSEKIGVVMNTPDEEIFPLRAPRLRNVELSNRFVIMYHGSLVERNGLDLAVAALAQVLEAVPAAELRIYGRKTPFLESVMGDAREKGLDKSVRYLGPKSLEDLVGEIEGCDVGVIPNHRNAFADINTPTRIFEYLALGKPVIAPRTPGIQDYFGPESLLFFESGDSSELARRLMEVYTQPSAALETAGQGQKIYLAHRWCEQRQTLVNLVSGLLERAPAQ
jgi:glycosyltransferase involved in cell wall biosynthesis